MKDVLKWGLIIGGAYYLLKDNIAQFFANSAAPATNSGNSGSAGSSAGSSGTPPASTALDTNSTRAAILAAAHSDPAYIAGNGRMNLWQWDYYYTQVRGLPGPDPAAIGFSDGAEIVTLDEYWAAMTGHGLGMLRPAAAANRRQPSAAWR